MAGNKGLSPKTYQGLNKKRMKKGSGGAKNKLRWKPAKEGADTKTVQFLTGIEDFVEFDQHVWQNGGQWNFVPCLGDECPLCEDEDERIARANYRFICNVYDHDQKKVLIMDGPKDLANRIALRYEKNPSSFVKRVWDCTKLPTEPVSYDVERSEARPVRTTGLEEHNLMKSLQEEIERFYGESGSRSSKKKTGPSALDDEWDEEDDFEEDDDTWTKDELLDLGPTALKEAASDAGVKVKKVTKDNRNKVIKAILRKQQ